MKGLHTTFAVLVILGGPLALGAFDAQAPRADRGQSTAKLHRKGSRAVPGRYIVVLRDDAEIASGDYAAVLGRIQAVTRGRAALPDHVYAYAIRGFAAHMPESDAVALSGDPRVAHVEEDSRMDAIATQATAPWGLDRIGQRDLPLNGAYGYTRTGAGVNAYIIDTGIRRTHTEFGGRALAGYSTISDGRGTTDCNGHGTHVAGIVGGATYGVAKRVALHAVRVIGCSGSGTVSDAVAGVDWVRSRHVKPAVANMSLGAAPSSALDTAVGNSIKAGVTFVVAAGNANADAANYSPARLAAAITVASSTGADARSSFSNFGSIVDAFAPGSSIRSAWHSGDAASRALSGTSMAAPHVAGVAARYLQADPTATPATVRNTIVKAATSNRLAAVPTGTANRLLYWAAAR